MVHIGEINVGRHSGVTEISVTGVTYFTRHAPVSGLGSFNLTRCGRRPSASSPHMEETMPRTIGIASVAALSIVAIIAWATASIRADAALKTLGPTATDAQIDTTELTKTARTLPVQNSDAF